MPREAVDRGRGGKRRDTPAEQVKVVRGLRGRSGPGRQGRSTAVSAALKGL